MSSTKAGLKITAGHRSNTGQIFNLTGQRELWPVKLTEKMKILSDTHYRQGIVTHL